MRRCLQGCWQGLPENSILIAPAAAGVEVRQRSKVPGMAWRWEMCTGQAGAPLVQLFDGPRLAKDGKTFQILLPSLFGTKATGLGFRCIDCAFSPWLAVSQGPTVQK